MVLRKVVMGFTVAVGACCGNHLTAPVGVPEYGRDAELVTLVSSLRPVPVGAEPLGWVFYGGEYRLGVMGSDTSGGRRFRFLSGGGICREVMDKRAMPVVHPANWGDLSLGGYAPESVLRSAAFPVTLVTWNALTMPTSDAMDLLVTDVGATNRSSADMWRLLVYSATVGGSSWSKALEDADAWARIFPGVYLQEVVSEQRLLMARGAARDNLAVDLPSWAEGSRGLELVQGEDGWVSAVDESDCLFWLSRAAREMADVWAARGDDRPSRCCMWTGGDKGILKVITVGELARFVLQCVRGRVCDDSGDVDWAMFITASTASGARDVSWREIVERRQSPMVGHAMRWHLALWPEDAEKVIEQAPPYWQPNLGSVATALAVLAVRPFSPRAREWLMSACSRLDLLDAIVVVECLGRDGVFDPVAPMRKRFLGADGKDVGERLYLMGVDGAAMEKWLEESDRSDFRSWVFALYLTTNAMRMCGIGGDLGEWERSVVCSLKSAERKFGIRSDQFPPSWEFDAMARLRGLLRLAE